MDDNQALQSDLRGNGAWASMTLLPENFVPGDNDVICSWARQNHSHTGNMKFRKLVEEYAPVYISADTKYDKTNVIATLIEKIRGDSPNGGFVKKDLYSGRWYEIGIERARDKVGHAVRKAADEVLREREGKGKKGKSKSSKVLVELKARTATSQQHCDVSGAGMTIRHQQRDFKPVVPGDANCTNSQTVNQSGVSKPQHSGQPGNALHGPVASGESLTPQELLLALGGPMSAHSNPMTMAPIYAYEEWHQLPLSSMNALTTTYTHAPVPNPIATTFGTTAASMSCPTNKYPMGSSREATVTIANYPQYHSVSRNNGPSSLEPHPAQRAPSQQARYPNAVTHYQQNHNGAMPSGEYPLQFFDQHFSTYPTGQGLWTHSFDHADLSSPRHENDESGAHTSEAERTERG